MDRFRVVEYPIALHPIVRIRLKRRSVYIESLGTVDHRIVFERKVGDLLEPYPHTRRSH